MRFYVTSVDYDLSAFYLDKSNMLSNNLTKNKDMYEDRNYMILGGVNNLWIPFAADIGDFPLGVNGCATGSGSRSLHKCSHAEGQGSIAEGKYSHAEGDRTVAAYAAHSEGQQTSAIGQTCHSEGEANCTFAIRSHVEGHGNFVGRDSDSAHVEGHQNKHMRGAYSHV